MPTTRRDRDWLLLFAGLICAGLVLVALATVIDPT